MTDIIKFNEEHTPKTEIGKIKFQLAEALNTLTDLQNGYKFPKLTATERHEKFNKAMITVCDILGIDLDMHELLKTGSEGFSYSDSAESTEALKYILDNKVVYSREIENEENTNKIITRNAIKELDSNKVYGFILKDGEFIVNEPNIVKVTAQSADKRFCYGDFEEFIFDHDLENLEYIVLEDKSKVSGSTALKVVGKLTYEQDQPQNTVKSIVKTLQNISLCPWEHAGEDMDVLGDLVYSYVSELCNALGFEDMSDIEAPTNEHGEQQRSAKDILLALHEDLTNEGLNPISLRDFGRIHVYDLADLLGIEELSSIRDIHIVEGEQWLKESAEKLSDQETYDNLPAEDKLNVDMLNKLHEVQDHILKSGQTAVGANRITTAVTLLEAGLGVIDHEEG